MPEPNYERDLLSRAAVAPYPRDLDDLTPAALQRIAAAEGIDFATALVFDRIVRSPRHGPFIKALESLSSGQWAVGRGQTCFLPPHHCPLPTVPRVAPTLAIVPGGFYKELRGSGADGRVLRETAARLGFKTELVPLKSFGSLMDNARILCDWLADQSEEPLVLASLSKAGAEVKIAIAQPNAADIFRNVRWWLNLSGVIDGTPLADWLLARRLRTLGCRLLCWLRGYDFGAIRELAGGPGSPLRAELRMPAGLRAIHVVGFPLAHHVTPGPIRRGFNRLKHLGPTDGAGILLARAGGWPGLLYPVWGADHYLRPRGQTGDALAERLLQFAMQPESEALTEEITGDAIRALPEEITREIVSCSSQGVPT